MDNTSTSSTKEIFTDRFIFLVEVIIVFLGVYLFTLLPKYFVDSLNGPLFYFLRALMLFLAVPIFLTLSKIVLEPKQRELIVEEDINTIMGHLKLYTVSKSNYKYQLLYGLLFLFLIFIPLDFFTYLLLPDLLEYNSVVIGSNPTDSHFFEGYAIFLGSAIIIQICVAIYEETLSRGFLTKRGSDNFNKISAVLIASLYFGLGHFAYIFSPSAIQFPSWFPVIWFFQAFFLGLVLSLFIVRKKWLFPAIFAHTLNNIISSHAVWLYIQGQSFGMTTLILYLPLLIISFILLIWQFPEVKDGISSGINELRKYIKLDRNNDNSKNEILVRIIADVLIGLIIFALGLFVFGI